MSFKTTTRTAGPRGDQENGCKASGLKNKCAHKKLSTEFTETKLFWLIMQQGQWFLFYRWKKETFRGKVT